MTTTVLPLDNQNNPVTGLSALLLTPSDYFQYSSKILICKYPLENIF
jgi:hypothetical protein